MKIKRIPNLDQRGPSDILVLPFRKGEREVPLDEAIPFLEPLLNSGDFGGNALETHVIYPLNLRESKILLLGLGDQETPEELRKAYGAATKLARKLKARTVNFLLPKEGIYALEGILLSNYSFDSLKEETRKDSPPLLEEIRLIGEIDSERVESSKKLIEGVFFARDLVNGNADDINPETLGKEAKSLEKLSKNISVTVFNRKWLEKEKMGLLLAVGKGAQVDPVLIQASYRGNPKSKQQVVLVGKGVTYDTGGLSLKPTDSMLDMKCDMGGAAAVLGAIKAVALLGLPINVTALVPSAENAIGSKSYKLGDVYRSYSGKTVEINNTDAEGRLILADAISYAEKNLNPSHIIDLATLTGAVMIALGENIAGFWSNDENLAKALFDASTTTTDPLWRLPLVPEYKEKLKSQIGDLVNSGGRSAGAITAALFLQEFVGKSKWAHIDIAGGAYLSKGRDYHPTRATGFGVHLLVEFLKKQSV